MSPKCCFLLLVFEYLMRLRACDCICRLNGCASSATGLCRMSEVSLPTDVIEPFSVSSLLSSTHAFFPQRINKDIAATAGKTRGIITQRDTKDLFSADESSMGVFSSLSYRAMKTFYDKLMYSVTQRGHKHTVPLPHSNTVP